MKYTCGMTESETEACMVWFSMDCTLNYSDLFEEGDDESYTAAQKHEEAEKQH